MRRASRGYRSCLARFLNQDIAETVALRRPARRNDDGRVAPGHYTGTGPLVPRKDCVAIVTGAIVIRLAAEPGPGMRDRFRRAFGVSQLGMQHRAHPPEHGQDDVDELHAALAMAPTVDPFVSLVEILDQRGAAAVVQ